jgi:hypothetical protein
VDGRKGGEGEEIRERFDEFQNIGGDVAGGKAVGGDWLGKLEDFGKSVGIASSSAFQVHRSGQNLKGK